MPNKAKRVACASSARGARRSHAASVQPDGGAGRLLLLRPVREQQRPIPCACRRRVPQSSARCRNLVAHIASSGATLFAAALHNGQCSRAFALWRMNTFYLHTPAWREKHPGVPNPFHDCLKRLAAAAMPAAECGRLGGGAACNTGVGRSHALRRVRRPQARWLAREADAELRLVQLFSADDQSFGHELGRANEWMEVMRSDSRPYFEEGIRPPNCTDWSPGETYHQQECWRDLHGWGGGRFPPGCWARPRSWYGSVDWRTGRATRTTWKIGALQCVIDQLGSAGALHRVADVGRLCALRAQHWRRYAAIP